MARAQAPFRNRAPTKPIPPAKAGTLAAAARGAGAVVGASLMAVFLGGLGGAHLALSTASPELAANRMVLQFASVPAAREALPAEIPAVAPAVPGDEPPVTAPGVDEAALARIYEEPLAADPTPRNSVALGDRPAMLQLAALPAPGEMPSVVPARRPPLWLRNAVPVSFAVGQPMIAIVLDDLGLNRPAARRAIALPAPLTLSFMTYAEGLRDFAAKARAAGHELLLHVPMEPRDPSYDAGPKVLRGSQSPREIDLRLQWGLARFDGFVGINNHMGSKFTSAPEGIAQVMRELRARDLLFLDSVTSPESVAWRAAARSGVPFARRDVFIDHDWRDPEAIRSQLGRLERLARQRGFAVGIGHPHGATLEVLAQWLPAARRRGIALVPISAIVSRQIEIAHKAGDSAG